MTPSSFRGASISDGGDLAEVACSPVIFFSRPELSICSSCVHNST